MKLGFMVAAIVCSCALGCESIHGIGRQEAIGIATHEAQSRGYQKFRVVNCKWIDGRWGVLLEKSRAWGDHVLVEVSGKGEVIGFRQGS